MITFNIPADVAAVIAAESSAFRGLLLSIAEEANTLRKAASLKFLPEFPSPFAWAVYHEIVAFGPKQKISAIKRLREWYQSKPAAFWEAGIYSSASNEDRRSMLDLLHAKNIIEAWIP